MQTRLSREAALERLRNTVLWELLQAHGPATADGIQCLGYLLQECRGVRTRYGFRLLHARPESDRLGTTLGLMTSWGEILRTPNPGQPFDLFQAGRIPGGWPDETDIPDEADLVRARETGLHFRGQPTDLRITALARYTSRESVSKLMPRLSAERIRETIARAQRDGWIQENTGEQR